jgi:hypothetical protein
MRYVIGGFVGLLFALVLYRVLIFYVAPKIVKHYGRVKRAEWSRDEDLKWYRKRYK